MEPIVFDGREFAKNKEVGLRIKVYELAGKGVKPKLVSILVGDDPASKLYVSLKQKAAERIGAELEIYEIGLRKDSTYIVRLIEFLNQKEDVHGIMVQLPLPARLKKETTRIINSIDPKKDVDGLRSDSPYVHPTSLAVVQILKEAKKLLAKPKKTLHLPRVMREQICVVGATGMVGTPLVQQLKQLGYKVSETDSKTKNLATVTKLADILISATGVPGLITGKMVKSRGTIIGIDVGSPHGDFNFEEVKKKVKFITPVPGGVGPLTIICLLENLIEAAKS